MENTVRIETMSDAEKTDIDTTSFANVLDAVNRMRKELAVEVGDVANKRQKLPERVQLPPLASNKSNSNVVSSNLLPPRIPEPDLAGQKIQNTPSEKIIIPKELPGFQPVRMPKDERKAYIPDKQVAKPGVTKNFHTFTQIQVSRSQTGNPLLEFLKVFQMNSKLKDIDYVINSKCVALFISLRYHKLHPEYIYNKLKKMTYTNEDILKVLLVYVDIEDFQDTVRELNKLCLFNNLTMILGWSNEQCATYLQNLKYVEKDASRKIIQGNRSKDDEVLANEGKYIERVVNMISSVKSVSQTDAKSLLAMFGSVQGIISADADKLQGIDGLGRLKIERLLDAFNKPFRED